VAPTLHHLLRLLRGGTRTDPAGPAGQGTNDWLDLDEDALLLDPLPQEEQRPAAPGVVPPAPVARPRPPVLNPDLPQLHLIDLPGEHGPVRPAVALPARPAPPTPPQATPSGEAPTGSRVAEQDIPEFHPRPWLPASAIRPVTVTPVPAAPVPADRVPPPNPPRPAPPVPARPGAERRPQFASSVAAPRPALPSRPTPPAEHEAQMRALTQQAPSGSFLREAAFWAEQDCTRSVRCAFPAVFVSYASLNRSQMNAYLYWRGRFRQGQVTEASRGALFLHAYELLHLIGVPSAQAARRELRRLYRQYRAQDERVASLLPRWCVDLGHYYALGEDAPAVSQGDLFGQDASETNVGQTDTAQDERELPWQTVLAEPWKIGEYPDVHLQVWLDQRQAFPDAPFPEVLSAAYRTSTARPTEYEQQHAHDPLFVTLRQRAITEVDAWERAHHPGGLGLFEQVRPEGRQPVHRRAFREAQTRFFGEPMTYPITETAPYHLNGVLAERLRQIGRHAENLHRAQTGEKNRLKAIDLPPDLKAHLTFARLVPPPPDPEPEAPAPLTLDFGRIARLHQESAVIRAALHQDDQPAEPQVTLRVIEGQTEPRPVTTVVAAEPEGAPNTPQGAIPTSSPAEPPADSAASPLLARTATVNTSWAALWNGLDAPGRATLLALQGQRSAQDTDWFTRLAQDHRAMPDLLVETLNEAGYDHLGDRVCDPYLRPPVLDEDHIQDLDALILHLDAE